MKYLGFILVLLLGMVSCDTRDDYFLEHGDAPIIEMKTSNDTLGVEYWEGKRYRVIEVGFGKPDTLTFSINDPYGKECTYDLKFESLPAENNVNGVYAEELLYYFGKEITTEENKAKDIEGTERYLYVYSERKLDDPFLNIVSSKGKIIFSLKKSDYSTTLAHDYLDKITNYTHGWESQYTQYKESYNLVHEKPFSKDVSARFALTAKNKINVETTEYVIVKIKPNRQPKPTLIISCVDKETNEYKITVDGSDPDGHEIVKWSYIFDYTPYKIGSKDMTFEVMTSELTGYIDKVFDGYLYYDTFESASTSHTNVNECFYWFTFGMNKKMMEQKKIEADFILPTTRNEVSHIFQSKGEHTISVRCQDEFGLWSDYITEKIYIE